MNHLEERLRIEGINETSVQEILQYVKDMFVEEYQEGYDDGVKMGAWLDMNKVITSDNKTINRGD